MKNLRRMFQVTFVIGLLLMIAVCSSCSGGEPPVDPLTCEHSTYGAWVTVDATYHSRACSVCGKTEMREHAMGDALSDGTDTHSVTCSDCALTVRAAHSMAAVPQDKGDGTHMFACSACDYTESEAHSLTAWTPAEDGKHERACTVCGDVTSEAHTPGAWTPTEDGKHERACTVCGDVTSEAHTPGAWTPTEDGKHESACTVCGDVTSEAHTPGAWTPTEDGKHENACTVCGDVTSEAHTPGAWTPAEDGKHESACTVCGDVTSEAHTPGAWTPAEDGKHERACTVCGDVTSEAHTPGAWTPADDGKHERACTVCSYRVTEAHTLSYEENRFSPTVDAFCGICDFSGTIENPDPAVKEFLNKKHPWTEDNGTVNLTMSIGDNSNGQALESGGMAYVSGEWTKDKATVGQTVSSVDSSILASIKERNVAAEEATGVHLTYRYMNVTDSGDWGRVKTQIILQYSAGDTSDIYYNFIYDMVGASIEGLFANIYGNEYLAPFYESFTADASESSVLGYNWAYMNDLTFSTKAMYLIASDYSFDITRATFVMPINLKLLPNVASVTGDRDGDGVKGTADDLFRLIEDGEWTWDMIAQYATALPQRTVTLSTSSGLSSTHLLYGSDLSIVQRTVNDDGQYEYSYPSETPSSLSAVFAMASNLVNLRSGTRAAVNLYQGNVATEAAKFTSNNLLINATCLLGSIEQDAYRAMWDTSKNGKGFMLAPIPKLNADQADYRTVVYNIGKVFAISARCRAVDEACAFINYQTLASTDILNEYLTWCVGDGHDVTEGNVGVLKAMRERLCNSHDLVVDHALGLQYGAAQIIDPTGDGVRATTFGNFRWHTYMLVVLRDKLNGASQIVRVYEGVYDKKLEYLNEIVDQIEINS